MLQNSTLQFLKELKKNNNKPWFDAHRKEYEKAKADFIIMVEALIKEIARFDPAVGNVKAKECIFRINRDVRFSKDKSPYKTNMGAYFSPVGKKTEGGGYYLHTEPGKSFVAGGMYMPMPPVLAKIRQEIDYNFAGWKKIVQASSFKKTFPKGVEGFEMLSRPPKGYDESNPAIHYLKMKNFVVTSPISDTDLKSTGAVKKIGSIYKTIKPMIDFLHLAMD